MLFQNPTSGGCFILKANRETPDQFIRKVLVHKVVSYPGRETILDNKFISRSFSRIVTNKWRFMRIFISIYSHLRLRFYLHQILIANQIGSHHGVGRLNVFETRTVCTGDCFPIPHMAKVNAGSHHIC